MEKQVETQEIRRDALVKNTPCRGGSILHFSDGRSELVEMVCGTFLPVLRFTSTISISTLRRGKEIIEEMFYFGRNEGTFDISPLIVYKKDFGIYEKLNIKLIEAGL